MSISFIEKGSTVGYQARVGTGGSRQTRFFAVKKYGQRQALALARASESEMRNALGPRAGARRVKNENNTSGVVGLGLRLVGSDATLSVTVAWREGGRGCATTFSTSKHGRIGATELAMRAREQKTGVPYDITARQAWLLMSTRLKARLSRSAGVRSSLSQRKVLKPSMGRVIRQIHSSAITSLARD